MPKHKNIRSRRRDTSTWRELRYEWHGRDLRRDMKAEYSPGELFSVRAVSQLPCLSHLSERYSYDVAIAVCSELYNRGKLLRQGWHYYFPLPQQSRRRRHNTYAAEMRQ